MSYIPSASAYGGRKLFGCWLLLLFLPFIINSIPHPRLQWKSKPLVYKGTNTAYCKYPFLVAVAYTFNSVSSYCTGIILSPYLVLTAAHCVCQPGGRIASSAKIFVNTLKASTGINYEAAVFHIPTVVKQACNAAKPNGVPTIYERDQTIIQLKTKIKFNRCVKIAALSTARPPVGTQVTVVGYGFDKNTLTKNKEGKLKEAETTLVPCLNHQLSDEALCVDGMNSPHPDYGDSGGPLLVRYNGRYIVHGTLFGYFPAHGNIKSLYSTINLNAPFINAIAAKLKQKLRIDASDTNADSDNSDPGTTSNQQKRTVAITCVAVFVAIILVMVLLACARNHRRKTNKKKRKKKAQKQRHQEARNREKRTHMHLEAPHHRRRSTDHSRSRSEDNSKRSSRDHSPSMVSPRHHSLPTLRHQRSPRHHSPSPKNHTSPVHHHKNRHKKHDHHNKKHSHHRKHSDDTTTSAAPSKKKRPRHRKNSDDTNTSTVTSRRK